MGVERFADKMSSGKFWMAMMVTVTYCGIMVILTIGFLKGIISSESYTGLLLGFTGLTSTVAYGYFNKKSDQDSDKKPEGEGL